LPLFIPQIALLVKLLSSLWVKKPKMWGKRSTNVAHLSCSRSNVPDPQCEQLHVAGGRRLWTCVGSVDCFRLRTVRTRRALPPTNPAYPPEFRPEAIRLVRTSDEHPIPEFAREIALCDGTPRVRNWVNQDEIDSGQRAGLTKEEKEEFAQTPQA
jgi:transposase-like protein